MILYKRHSKKWREITRQLSSQTGIKLGETNYHLRIIPHSENFNLYTGPANSNNVSTIFQMSMGHTMWCCGVSQYGNFYEHSRFANVPAEVKTEMLKILLSYSHNMFNKGVVNAWFYKNPRKPNYEHIGFLELLKANKFKKFGRASYNPNSGNTIQGYQLTISRKPRNGNS